MALRNGNTDPADQHTLGRGRDAKSPHATNRDTVSEAYLSDIYAEVLNESHEIMDAKQFGDQWVKQAIEDPRTEAPAVVATVTGRYGDKVLLTSPNADANMRAAQDSYELINPRSLSSVERERFRNEAGVQTTNQLFGREEPSTEEYEPQTDDEIAFAQWVVDMADKADLTAKVRMIHDTKAHKLADCTANTTRPTIRFNKALLDDDFFTPPYGRIEQIEIVIHELGHAVANKPMEHGPAWGEGVALVGAKIAASLYENNNL